VIQLGEGDLIAKPDETETFRRNIVPSCRVKERDGQERG